MNTSFSIFFFFSLFSSFVEHFELFLLLHGFFIVLMVFSITEINKRQITVFLLIYTYKGIEENIT